MSLTVQELSACQARERVGDFVALSKAVIDAGSHLGWDVSFDGIAVSGYWQHRSRDIDGRNVLLFGSFSSDDLLGTVQLERGHFPTSLHRAEVAKLMVAPSARRRGIASQLMDELEKRAVTIGIELLVLDTRAGEPVEILYQRRGYTRTGHVPHWMKYRDGSYKDTVFFYKLLKENI